MDWGGLADVLDASFMGEVLPLCGVHLHVVGALVLLAGMCGSARAQYNPEGWIWPDAWNFLMPLPPRGQCARIKGCPDVCVAQP